MSYAPISRRTALRGMGVCVALPFFESLVGTARCDSLAESPRRLLFVYAPNGKHMPDWTPQSDGTDFEMPPTLRPLAPVRDCVTVLSGLAQRNANPGNDGPGDHARAMATFLTGCRPRKTSGSDVHLGISVDQIAAAAIGRFTRLASLEVGCEGGKPAKHHKLRRINLLHVEQFAYLLERLQGTMEGDHNLLDRCLAVYGSGIRDGDRHDHDDLPILVAGGGIRGSRHVRYPAGTPLCNLYLSLLHRLRVPAERFGDSTGCLSGFSG